MPSKYNFSSFRRLGIIRSFFCADHIFTSKLKSVISVTKSFVTKCLCHQKTLSPNIFVTKCPCHQKFVTICTVTKCLSPKVVEPFIVLSNSYPVFHIIVFNHLPTVSTFHTKFYHFLRFYDFW